MKEEEYSDKKVTIFLIVAILISLVSTWTVLYTLNEVSSTEKTEKQPQSPQPTNTGLISLSIIEEEINATQ